MIKITKKQTAVLQHLHRFRFLTTTHLQALQVSKNPRYIRHILAELRAFARPLTRQIKFPVHPTKGQLPAFHCLTRDGAKVLAEIERVPLDEINYIKGNNDFEHDYFHRVQTIDLHISAHLLCELAEGSQLDFFDTYFNPSATREASSKIQIEGDQYFIPDANFQITDPNGKPWLFTAEIYRNHSTKRVHTQLINHLRAIGSGAISQKYNFPRGVPVLVICEEQSAMRSLMKRCADDPQFRFSQDYFLFRDMGTDAPLFDGWQTFSGAKKRLFE